MRGVGTPLVSVRFLDFWKDFDEEVEENEIRYIYKIISESKESETRRRA